MEQDEIQTTRTDEFEGRQGRASHGAGEAEKIERGSTLADAMAEHPCFSHMVVQLVRVGEQTGILEQVVTRAAESLERRRQLRTHLLTALFYPTLVLISAIGVATFMIVSVT